MEIVRLHPQNLLSHTQPPLPMVSLLFYFVFLTVRDQVMQKSARRRMKIVTWPLTCATYIQARRLLCS